MFTPYRRIPWSVKKKVKGYYRLKRQQRRTIGLLRSLKAPVDIPIGSGTVYAEKGGALSRALFGKTWADANDDQKKFRRAFNYRGEGGYWDKIAHYGLRGLGSIAGSLTGEGLQKGWDWGAKASQYFGYGDYSTNQIIGGGQGNQQQIAVNQGDLSGDVYIARTEFVQNIVITGTGGTSSTFNVNRFELNPGLSSTFPILSQLANNFELYDFQGLIFQYKPTFSENSGTANNLGKVIMCTNYDPDSSNFINGVQMENYDYANSTKPSQGCIHGVETANHQQTVNMMYTRTGLSNKDRVLTDLGVFQLATEGIPLSGSGTQTQIIGELWVTYKIKLSRMQIFTNLLGGNIQFASYGYTASGTQLFNAITVSDPDNTLAMSLTNISSTSMEIAFPSNVNLGLYEVEFRCASGATNFTTQAATLFSNFTNCSFALVNGWANGEQVNSTLAIYTKAYILVNAPSSAIASFRFNVTAALTATTTCRLFISQININQQQ